MQIFKTLKLIWTFYQSFLFYCMLVTGSGLVLFYKYGFAIFQVLCWFKTVTLGLSYFFINEYKQKEYYYYRNLGVSNFFLWTVTLLFDFILFICLIIAVYQFK